MIGSNSALERRVKLAKQVLIGHYTRRKIPISWEGRPARYDLINDIIKTLGYQSYLEIGCRGDACYSRILAPKKTGVDPASGGTHRMTSDAFFAQNHDTFDLIFIDGLHVYEQVIVDIRNALACLSDNGTIVMHDCLPRECLAQYDFQVIHAWNGDTWKAFVEARTLPDVDAATCLIDHGVGIIKKRTNRNPLLLDVTNFKRLKYAFLAKDYTRIMNTMEYPDALAFATRP